MKSSLGGTDRTFIFGTLGVAALLLLLVPVARQADEITNRKRPMYEDLARIKWVEYRVLQSAGSAVPVDVAGGDAVEIGDVSFRPSPGVRVEVAVPEGEEFCARVSNDHGDRSIWHCFDPARPPSDPDRSARR